MKMNCDLHCHSGYAGGVGNISLADVEKAMPLKGIDIVGTGDVLQQQWLNTLKSSFLDDGSGLFVTAPDTNVRFVLQTEIIFTSPVGEGRKIVHHVLLFPSFESVDRCRELMNKWEVKLNIGRPFVKCRGKEDVARRLNDIHGIDPLIESIPAHVMTPDGVYGSKNPVTSMEQFYGEGVDLINSVETGLSADPTILGQIPELDDFTLLSNSDAHSAQLHRMGREFTTLELRNLDFPGIIRAVRENHVCRTAEFNPMEGRYFLTGHRKGKKGHGDQYCMYSPSFTPNGEKCPICKKQLTVGVLERSQILKEAQGGDDRDWGYRPKSSPDFVHMVPLVEIIAYTLGIGSPTSKRVIGTYHDTIDHLGNECAMWFMNEAEIEKRLTGNVEENLLNNILMIKRGNFNFSPMGYDGTYGKLSIGERSDIFGIKVEHMNVERVTMDRW